ncbi:AAA family ATPase [Sphingomonas swuensis]|uniref:AAA family ATPase n=1 Tax=Sphingomonas swuensis TaxID=977800 RepID=A0ABP7T0U9_9SPHN
MRILAIRGRNLASLAGDFAIDFEAEPLTSSGIFAITGPTGAGKSTILDALSLALFNKVPRLAAAPNRSQIPDGSGQALSADDPRAILRHGAGEGFAEVDFSMPSGARYRARWSVKRARERADGRLQGIDHEFQRLDTGERLGGTRTETLAEICRVIGLSAEQFGRAVLLAQGDFEAFIRAAPDERALLLERLTGSSIYARLGQRACEKAAALQAQLDGLKARMGEHQVLGDEQRAEIELAAAEARAAEAAATEKVRALEHVQRWEERADELKNGVAAAEQQASQALAEVTSAAPRRDALARDRAAFSHVAAWSTLRDVSSALDRALRRIEEERCKAAEAVQQETQASGDEEAAQSKLSAVAAQAAQLQPELQQARNLDAKIVNTAGRLASLEADLATRLSSLGGAEQADTEARASLTAAESKLAENVAWLEGNAAIQPLAQREEELAEHLTMWTEARESLTALTSQQEEHLIRLTALTTTRETTLRELDAHNAEQAAALVACQEAVKSLPPEGQLGDLTERSEALGQLALLANNVANAADVLSSVRRDLETATERRALLGRQLSDATARKEQKERQIRPARVAYDDARRELELLTTAASDAAEALRASLVEGEPCPVCGSETHQLTIFEGRLGDHLRARREAAAALQQEVESLQQAVAADAADIRSITEALASLEPEVADRESRRSSADERYEIEKARLDRAADLLGLAVGQDLGAEIATQKATILTQIEDSRRAQGRVEAARQHESAVRQSVERAQAAFHSADEAHAAEVLQGEALTRSISAQQDTVERHALVLDRSLGRLVDWKAIQDPLSWLRKQAADWRTQEQARASAEKALPALRATCERTGAARSAAQALKEEADAVTSGTRNEHDGLVRERSGCLAGATVADTEARLAAASEVAVQAAQEARGKREEAQQARVAAEVRCTEANSQRAELDRQHTQLQEQLAAALQAATLSVEEVAHVAARGEAALDAERTALDLLDRTFAERRAVVEQCQSSLNTHLAAEAFGRLTEGLADAVAEAIASRDAAAEQRHAADMRVRLDDHARLQNADLRAEYDRQAAAADIWLKLSDLIGDREGRTFRRFAQGLTLDLLLQHANERLSELKPRYSLERGFGGDMLIQVVDNDMAGEVRGLHNLSGGERFLISLALALGLAEMSTSSGVRIESLFIDEGFGALDPASLGQAIALLEQLQASGRRVGVISHVEELKERIPVKIEVTPTSRGTSRIEVSVS